MRKIKSTPFIFLVLIFCALGFSKNVRSQASLNKIVIDAGHGGKDPGASGKYSREKDVALAVALQTGKLIQQKHPDVEIIYTRKTDVFIPLKERAEIANKSNADLFISIHCNANKSSQPHGSETYVMGLHKSEANLSVAKTENSAILFEEDYETNYEGFDPTSEENHIIFNFFQNSFLSHNLDLATRVQNQFAAYTPLHNRGVKQAGFWVLYKTTMPGILIETGFLSNSSDEKFLNSKKGQKELSEAITSAISDYKKDHDAKEQLKAGHLKENPPADPAIKEEHAVSEVVQKKEEEPKQEEIIKEAEELKKEPIEEVEAVEFSIQFLSLSTQKELSGGNYDQLSNISSYLHNGMYRYTTGSTKNYEKAVQMQSKVRKAGFKDAFVVAFYKGKRISIKEAKELNIL